MDGRDRVNNIVKEISDSTNNELLFALNFLNEDYEKTKDMIINLTKHLDSIEIVYNKVLSPTEFSQVETYLKTKYQYSSW
jgi:hypothetical protein